MIVEGLRRARTGAYWLAGPVDRLCLRLSGRDLPPLWLRRHTGAVSRFESAARETAELLDRLALVTERDRVLDIGCGAGAMVAEIVRRLGPEGRYIGFDVHAPSIRWCRERYAADPRLTFEIAAVASVYGAASGSSAASYRFPVGDGQADLVLAKSVFTHLFENDARHYLQEARRALRRGGAAVVTAFLFDETGPTLDAVRRLFPRADERGLVRWRFRFRPTAAVAFARSRFVEMVEAAGLRVQWLSPGFFPGTRRLTGQDTLLLGH